MLYGVKVNGEELLIAKKDLIFFTFYMVKRFDKILNGNLCLLKKEEGRGGGDILA